MDHTPASSETFAPTTTDELARFLRENASGARRAAFPVGGRTALHYGDPRGADDITIILSDLNRIVDYPARDMTITVEAGMRMDDLQKTLQAEGQRLPIDVPQSHRATLGGAIATNTSGPGRYGHGTFRDYVIGVSAVDGQGRVFSSGGRVVKNVAGYDLCKLLVGSLGTLAIITQVSLKVRPLTESRKCLWATFAAPDRIEPALEHLLASQTRPVAVEVLNPAAVHQVQGEARVDLPVDRYALCLTYEGTVDEVAWQVKTVHSELAESAPEDQVPLDESQSGRLWTTLCEYQAASDDPLTFQASVPPSAAMPLLDLVTGEGIAAQCHAGNGILIGHLPDRCSTLKQADEVLTPLRRHCEQSGGSLVVLACDDEWKPRLSLFGTPRDSARLETQIKSALDPHNLLSPPRSR